MTARDDPARPGAGLSLLMFAAELASAARPDEYRGDLPAALVAECEQAACLSGFAEMAQALAALTG